MNMKDYAIYLLPKSLQYRLSRLGFARVGRPITLTYSVTAACQSKCKTCNIGFKFREDPKRKEKDLKLEEIGKINHLNTAYFVDSIAECNHVNVKYKKDFYNEVVLEIKNLETTEFIKKLEEKKIIVGIPMSWFFPDFENSILINFTEIHKKEDIDRLVNSIRELK